MRTSEQRIRFQRILGVNFFSGSASDAVDMVDSGGLLVVPAAPALKNLPYDLAYSEALLNADLAITDSAFMVVVWNLIQRDTIRRLSGLEYLRELLKRPQFRIPGQAFWIMAHAESSQKNETWLRTQGLAISKEDIYLAPFYGEQINDEELVTRLRNRRPKHIIITLGGGTQERLGLYLKRNLDYSVAIHCIGAAIAFLTGDQVRIPNWADRMYLGWLFRCVSEPIRYAPRYWGARHLMPLIIRYKEQLPKKHL